MTYRPSPAKLNQQTTNLALHIPPTRNHQSLPTNITKQRTANRHDRTRSLRCTAGPPQRNISISRARILLFLRNAQSDLLAVGGCDEGSLLFGGGETGLDVSKSDSVGADAEGGTPFFGDGFGEADDAGFLWDVLV